MGTLLTRGLSRKACFCKWLRPDWTVMMKHCDDFEILAFGTQIFLNYVEASLDGSAPIYSPHSPAPLFLPQRLIECDIHTHTRPNASTFGSPVFFGQKLNLLYAITQHYCFVVFFPLCFGRPRSHAMVMF